MEVNGQGTEGVKLSPDILGCSILECETVNGLNAKKAA